MYLHFLISYEGCDVNDIGMALVALEDENIYEHFDGSYVDGSEVYLISVEGNAKAAPKWQKKLQDLVWVLNGGASCSIRELTEEQYEEYC